ncbi:MAG: hypothetical protein ACM3SS_09200 [Rhodospirillaceae bacterium]
MLSAFFSSNVYVRVNRNQFRLRHIESGTDTTVQSDTPFTTQRLLIGDFTAAERTLKAALKRVVNSRLISISPRVLIQPLEMIEGGLSQVEDRVLREVAIGAGASKVIVWVGSELADSDVTEKLNGK